MIDYENIRKTIVKGLKDYLQCAVIRQNQNKEPPQYPYISYTITTLASENKGTYGEYEDGVDRKPILQTWSISAQSDDSKECVNLVNKAFDWLDHYGTTYLNDNNVIVQSVGSITNRDNLLTVEYEYKYGFDIVLWLYDEIKNPISEAGEIEEYDIGGNIE